MSSGLRIVGLFAGIGGIELGLRAAGHKTDLVCEIDDAARAVLRQAVAERKMRRDIRRMTVLPPSDLVAAGFPCQDLSQAGRTAGIAGANSGLVDSVFRLIETARRPPTWLLLENVPFMLQLDRGRAMEHLTTRLENLGFRWAYRVVDTRSFGLPQRRLRVILLASKTEDPRGVLLGESKEPNDTKERDGAACGFYWTEGSRGLGWAVDAVPTLKGGSTIGIPSPPAIWMPDGRIVVPDIRDAERLQGFEADWTKPADDGSKRTTRWKLVGNAVSVPVSTWVGERLAEPAAYEPGEEVPLDAPPWPTAAWGEPGRRFATPDVTTWPKAIPADPLAEFLKYPVQPLSRRATAGFLARGFLNAVANHLRKVEADQLAA
jgi:DNA (cytosine-5)-methyltransferase 1